MYGYTGKLLHVNLSTQKITKKKLPMELARSYLGGRGLGAKILYDELEPATDPFDPGNPLIFTTGPFTGVIPGCPKFAAITKSPLTGIYCTSISGSYFGSKLKSAGYDGLVIKGKAAVPSYLSITNNSVEIKDAKHLWGMSTSETDENINKELGEEVRSLCIGPAGEKLVRFACAISDKRAAGRGGTGAVMGSKKLKAIAVKGDETTEIYNSDSMREPISELLKEMTTNPGLRDRRKYGTPAVVDFVNELGLFPTRNYLKATFKGANKINGKSLVDRLIQKNISCYSCPIGCGALSTVKTGPYKGATSDGPEYETLYAFGANCENDYLESIVAADQLCDDLGLDTISTGCAIGFAMECYEKGLITEKEAGMKLTFGNHEAMVEMIKKIGNRDGFGNVLAEGVKRSAEKIKGSKRFAMHVKGLELPGWGVRGSIGMGLAYATACRGGCHSKAVTIGQEVVSGNYDPYSPEGKGELVKRIQDGNAVLDSLVVCTNGPNRIINMTRISSLLSLITGWEISTDEILETGERISNMERLINVREGMRRKDDSLPERLFKDPVPEGPTEGHLVGVESFETMLNDYYSIRGWDSQGIPSKEKLDSLRIHQSGSKSIA